MRISAGLTLCALAMGFVCGASYCQEAESRTVIVSAEGLADVAAESFQGNQGLLLQALRQDALRQVIEKAVGVFVDGPTLLRNYSIISDQLLSQSEGLIKQIVKESEPWQGDDGFMHVLIKAEVELSGIGDAIRTMSKSERVNLIKEYGDPKISVALTVRDADRGSAVPAERSLIAENILKERLTSFGYRVWSERGADPLLTADFSIGGEAKFKSVSQTLAASGITITKYALTSLTISCVDNFTGQELLPMYEVPKNQTWPDEDAALEEIGRLIGAQFSESFFRDHLLASTKKYQVEAHGIPDYDVATLLKKEMMGLRSVFNVDLRNFNAGSASVYEVDFAGGRENFMDFINGTVVKPLNKKLGARAFSLIAAQGDVVKLKFESQDDPAALVERFNSLPPASLSTAPLERVAQLVQSESAMQSVAAVNPEMVQQLVESGSTPGSDVVRHIADF